MFEFVTLVFIWQWHNLLAQALQGKRAKRHTFFYGTMTISGYRGNAVVRPILDIFLQAHAIKVDFSFQCEWLLDFVITINLNLALLRLLA